MTFTIKRVGHLVLRVKDLERSKRFFEKILHLPVVGQNERGMVFFNADAKDNHHMSPSCQRSKVQPCPARAASECSTFPSISAVSPNCRRPTGASRKMA
jgi:catechol 2,3-dioxygenase-like lactoylglutathione lyase family enzyme